jgi:hypothetical protein
MDLPDKPDYELRGGVFWHLKDGIILGKPTPHDMTLEDAKQFTELFWRLEPGGKFRILIDQRGVSRKLDAGARGHLLNDMQSSLDRLAIVTGNTISRFFASSILATLGMGSKARAFDSDDDALTWLRTAQRQVR